MQVDLIKFCGCLRDEPEQKAVDMSGVSPYLINNLYYPYVSGKQIYLTDLDYSQFTLDELDEFLETLDELTTLLRKTQGIQEKLWKTPAVPRAVRAFC